jgi:hypothetical protein
MLGNLPNQPRPTIEKFADRVHAKGRPQKPDGPVVMGTNKSWELVPDLDYSDRANWLRVGKDRYAGIRLRLLIIRSDPQESRLGPKLASHTVGPDHEVSIKVRRVTVRTTTAEILQAVKFTTASRLLSQIAAKVTAKIASKTPLHSAEFGSELLSKSEYEITSSTEETLSIQASHSIEETHEEERTITFKVSDHEKTADLRRRYWPRRYEFYLHSYDYLELSYMKGWIWDDVKVKKIERKVLGWPLASVTFYEPQPDLDVTYGRIDDVLEEPDSIIVQELTAEMPNSKGPQMEQLEDLAKLAFPTSRKDRRRAREVIESRRRTPSPPGARPSAEEWWGRARAGAARKASAKKAARKVSAKKLMSKKPAAKKFAARKTAAKKSVGRKTVAKKAAAKRR